MKMIVTVKVIKTATGATLDLCVSDDGMTHLRVNNGRDEIIVTLNDDEATELESALHDATT